MKNQITIITVIPVQSEDINDVKINNNNKDKDKEDDELSKIQKLIYTILHFYIHLTFGLTISSMSPAFVDFREILNTRIEWIGLFPTFQCVGTLLGCCFTLLYKWLNRQITFSILVIGMSLTTIFMPWSTQLWHLYLCILVYGVGAGAWNAANNVILIEIWQNKSPAILQFCQFFYGVGSVLGPLLSRNYVIGEMICPGVYPWQCSPHLIPDNLNTTFVSPLSLTNGTNECSEECLHYDRRPVLRTPFLIGGILLALGPIAMLAMFFIKRYHYSTESSLEVRMNDQQKERYKKFVPKTTIIIFVWVVLAFAIMSENMYTDFSSTFFQFQPVLRLSAERASEIMSSMAIAFSIGRGLSIFISLYVKPQYMISYQLIIVFAGYVYQIFGQNQLVHLWSSAIVICFGYSSIFISLFSFVGQYMDVSDKIGGLFIGSYNSIYPFLPYFISYYIERVPNSFLYIEISCLSVAILAFIGVMIAVRNVPDDLIRKTRSVETH